MKIATIVGARPQFIKASVVSRAIAAHNFAQPAAPVHEILVHTGQHHDAGMSDIFFRELGIPHPAHNLGIQGLSHGAMTGRMLEALERVLVHEAPDVVLVYGDTNSTLAGALAAAKIPLKLAHVEAGLRSFNRAMPEEINRLVADRLSDLLFAPTAAAVANLRHEGVPEERVRLVGDVMYDAALHFGAIAEQESRVLATLDLRHGEYALATVHRQENTDDRKRLRAILEGLLRVASTLPVVCPLHPRTAAALSAAGLLDVARSRLRLTDPMGYLDMAQLERHARLILTDSGGVQKEAYFHGVPCVTLRDETEWVELVEAGANRLAGADPARIATAVDEALHSRMPTAALYGDGHSGAAVVHGMVAAFGTHG